MKALIYTGLILMVVLINVLTRIGVTQFLLISLPALFIVWFAVSFILGLFQVPKEIEYPSNKVHQ